MMIRADVKCYYCGHVSGQMEGDPANCHSQWSFRSATGLIQPSHQSGQRIRCNRCGGPVYLDEIENVRASSVSASAARSAAAALAS